MFDDKFIESLPEDLKEAGHRMCQVFKQRDYEFSKAGSRVKYYDEYLEAYAAIETLVSILNMPLVPLKLGRDRSHNIDMILGFFNSAFVIFEKAKEENVLSNARDKFKSKFGAAFLYRFSDGDLKRIQVLLNQLRDLVRSSELFDAKHKERILTKLEKLQLELHKYMSSLDKFWGLIGDAGIVLGKFGRDAKPFVDRIREISQIIWRTQAISEELPSGTSLPLLADDKPKEND